MTEHEYSEGLCHGWAAILKDGQPMAIEDILKELRKGQVALTQGVPDSFQKRVEPWLLECFGEMIAGDREERNHRFLEEALKLVQSQGCTKNEAMQLVDYVYGREIGHPPQEVGGVMVTLAALCLASDMDMHECGETELARVWTKVEQIREKQKRKPQMGPLPGAYPDRPMPPKEVE